MLIVDVDRECGQLRKMGLAIEITFYLNEIELGFVIIFRIRHPRMSNSLKDKRKAVAGKIQVKKEETTKKILAERYELIRVIGNGVSSVVYEGVDRKTSRKVAVKNITRFLQNKHQSLRILREIILLRILDHPNIIKLREIVLDGEGEKKQLYLILDFHPFDLKKIFKSIRKFHLIDIKAMVFQILCGLNYCHQSQVLHRDLKPENILVTEDLSEVKLCDFGLARAVMTEEQKEYEVNKEESERQNSKFGLSAHVTTRWYRAPELIILEKKYNCAIDIWSVGCIFAELLGMLEENGESFTQRKVLFPGKACYPLSPPKNNETNYKKVNDFPHSVSDQLSVIFDVLGTPDDISFIKDERARNYIKSFGKIEKRPFKELFNYIPKEVEDFLEKCLSFNPNERITIGEAMKHPLFDEVRSKFEVNANIEGEPVITDIENLSMEEIRERVFLEYDYYQKSQKEE